MWFKNLCLYQFEQPFTLTPEQLDEKLAQDSFNPCGRLEMGSAGWVPPVGEEGAPLVFTAGGYLMVCLKEQNKLLPASVIRETLAERVSEREEQDGRKLRKKEKDRLKDEVVVDLLPRAFARSKRGYAYIDPQGGWLVADAASWRQAEELTERLRSALGTLPIAPPKLDTAPQSIMTDWLYHERLPSDFALGDECVLTDPQVEGSEIRCKRQDLGAGEIKNHIKAGKRVQRLALKWQDRLVCSVEADLGVKRLRFSDVVQDESSANEAETELERFDSDFSIMTLELSRFIPRLIQVLGGEEEGERKEA